MKTITIRGLNEHLSEKLKQAAKKEAKSINQFVIDSIRKSLGEEKEKKFSVIHHDMDHLFGKWSEQEWKQIEKTIHMERKIDKELWL
ncbi:MAG: antitoxin [Desulfobacterium sp.]|nr:antitoxin [Desulfobacterium sp.]